MLPNREKEAFTIPMRYEPSSIKMRSLVCFVMFLPGGSLQRLEFLGDAVLDILVTRHLYESHSKVDPGLLTDMRSASVNNDNFARSAVRWNLHPHLQRVSSLLKDQISEFVSLVSTKSTSALTPDIKGPKVS